MKPRSRLTPFRRSQAKHALEGMVRWLAPSMMVSPLDLRDALLELAQDNELWAEIATAAEELPEPTKPASTPATSSVMTAPIAARKALWEHRCEVDDQLRRLTEDMQRCGACGAERPSLEDRP